MKKILMSAAALLLSAVGAYAAQQKYYFLYEEGHEDQPETSWFILDREAKKYIPFLYGDYNYTIINDVSKLPEKLPRLYLRLTR